MSIRMVSRFLYFPYARHPADMRLRPQPAPHNPRREIAGRVGVAVRLELPSHIFYAKYGNLQDGAVQDAQVEYGQFPGVVRLDDQVTLRVEGGAKGQDVLWGWVGHGRGRAKWTIGRELHRADERRHLGSGQFLLDVRQGIAHGRVDFPWEGDQLELRHVGEDFQGDAHRLRAV